AATSARARMPGLWMPSSFDTRMRTRCAPQCQCRRLVERGSFCLPALVAACRLMTRGVRVALVLNENAGSAPSAGAAQRMIEAAGHRVVARLHDHDLAGLDPGDVDLVAVAGGDGTVRGAVIAMAGVRIPLAVIPFGTANNVAATLGFSSDPEQAVRAWRRARRIPLDLGIARGSFGEHRFLESAGGGLVARGIAVMDAEAPHPEEGDRYGMLRKAQARFASVLDGLRPQPCRWSLDGEEREGELLLFEVLNSRSVGPRLALAPENRPADGAFDVVIAGEAERAELAAYLRDRAAGRRHGIRLPMQRAAHVRVQGWDDLHVDDRVH